jgi:cardiolipin synthase
MKILSKAIARIAREVHPDSINGISEAMRGSQTAVPAFLLKKGLGASCSQELVDQFSEALKETPGVSNGELAAMFQAASATASLVENASSVELVWTGPGTGLVPVRHTSQVLKGLIDEANENLFIVSYVAQHIGGVLEALGRAIARGVITSILVELSKERGGNVDIDSVKMLKKNLPGAQIYQWDKRSDETLAYASVHAKCAVADYRCAFVTSANLTEAAMERNMELGVLVRGGPLPHTLAEHLNALVTTKRVIEI